MDKIYLWEGQPPFTMTKAQIVTAFLTEFKRRGYAKAISKEDGCLYRAYDADGNQIACAVGYFIPQV